MRAVIFAFGLALASAGYAQEPEATPGAKPEEKAEVKPEAKPEEKAEAKPEEKAEAKPEEKLEEKIEKKAEGRLEEIEPEHEHHEEGITNWWSLDYGPKANNPAHKGWPPPFGFALLNFFVFLGIMYKLLGKPLGQMVRDRHDRIKTDLDEAKKLRDGAAAMLNEYKKKVENVDLEIESLLKSIRSEAEGEKARIIAAAEEQAKRLKADAERQIAAEIDRAKSELRRGVIEAAVATASELLQKHIGSDDQRKMAEAYVKGLEKKAS